MDVPDECPYQGWDLYINETWEHLKGQGERGIALLNFYQGVMEALTEHFQRNELLRKVVRTWFFVVLITQSADIETLRRVPLDFQALLRDLGVSLTTLLY